MRKRRNSYQNFFRPLGLIFFLTLLLVLIVNLVLPNRSFSEKENRVLASRPDASLSQIASGRFGEKYETYVNDQFFFRDFWVTLKARFDRILGKVEENGVYLGKDGYLMEAFVPPAPGQPEAAACAMTAFADRHPELKHYALIAPNAVNILKDKLPAFAPTKDQNPYLDQLFSTLSASEISCIDVREALSNHKDEGIYYHTDHHWTTKGAYFAYLEASKAMNLNSGILSYERLPASDAFQGTLSAKSGFRSSAKEPIDVYLPKGDGVSSIVNYVDQQQKTASFYDTDQLLGRDKYALFFGGNHPQVKISTPVKDNRNLLVLKDSYANCLVPFLAPHYRNIIMIDPRYYFGDLEELIAVEDIQEVLYLYNANTFFGDTSLEMALAGKEE